MRQKGDNGADGFGHKLVNSPLLKIFKQRCLDTSQGRNSRRYPAFLEYLPTLFYARSRVDYVNL